VIFTASFEVNSTPLRKFCRDRNKSPMVQGQDYKVDASKLPNQILTIIDGLTKMCGVWRCRNERRHLSY